MNFAGTMPVSIDRIDIAKMNLPYHISGEVSADEQWKMAVCIFFISIIGAASTVMAAITMLGSRDLNNTFGRLSMTEICTASFVLFAHAVWVAPVVYLNIPVVPYVDAFIGTLVFFMGSAQVASTFACALNRYLAVSHSIHYYTDDNRRFKNRFFILAYATVIVIPFAFEPCRPFLHRFAIFFLLNSRTCTTIHNRISFQALPAMFLIAHAVLDVLTFIKLKGTNKNEVLYSQQIKKATTKRNKKFAQMQHKFVHQALFSTVLRWTAIVTVIVSTRIVNGRRHLAIATIAWLTYNAVEGFVIIGFNWRSAGHSPRPSPSQSQARLQGVIVRLDESHASTAACAAVYGSGRRES